MREGDQRAVQSSRRARRIRWIWAPLWCSAGVTVVALLCLAWLNERSIPVVAVAHGACMARTFGLQIGVALLLISGCACAMRAWRAALVAVVLAAVWLAPEGWKHVRPVQHVSEVGETLTVVTVNAQFGGCDPAAVAREAAACDADVVLVQEFTAALEPKLDAALADYPHRVRSARSDAYGQAIYSRRPLIASETQAGFEGVNDHPRVSAAVQFGGREVRISNVHLVSPISVERVVGQRLEAAALAADMKRRLAERGSSGQELLLVGDFNATADGPIIGAFIDAGLIDGWVETQRGRGGTWPAQGIASYLERFRIDNLLQSDGLVCVASGVGAATGSDHLPTWARYVRARDREPSASVGDQRRRAR